MQTIVTAKKDGAPKGFIVPKTVTLRENIAKHWELYLFVLPALTLIIVFRYIPLYGVTIAFKDFRAVLGITGSPWVGFAHFQRFFSTVLSSRIIMNTLILNLMQFILGFPVPILLAILLHHLGNVTYRKIVQTSTYLPYFVSVVVIVGMMYLFLSPRVGIYGHAARFFGFSPGLPMGSRVLFRWLYVYSGIWQNTGWGSIIYFASLAGVSLSLYEASKVDGATIWQQIWHIDLPHLTPTIVILLILRAGQLMEIGFEKVFLMQNSLNIVNSEVLSTYVYKVGLLSAQFSYSTAIDIFRNGINCVMLLMVNKIANVVRGDGLF